ncbi:hypothetical protein GCK72_025325 [Caenorhabditis remanei]|uniref:Uncharacterized protein n=1 Tax=Caenorhabditis remanei TaxID=31234 RepID=A0A6A5G1P3_CAERE|nr:hypothetical protein GCK72_025315 [Caenorhabditis remanei]XP_053579860.1 hypothetical protein GCK72_025325 [Caenorhabditis remanei]KAF1748848.1 hypothetical protein GCK72_025315 [Caenorhabditis remanei]KAF1748858.1 hypothetical protein GCK72_025325 [Caenorhabditis remanei]
MIEFSINGCIVGFHNMHDVKNLLLRNRDIANRYLQDVLSKLLCVCDLINKSIEGKKIVDREMVQVYNQSSLEIGDLCLEIAKLEEHLLNISKLETNFRTILAVVHEVEVDLGRLMIAAEGDLI